MRQERHVKRPVQRLDDKHKSVSGRVYHAKDCSARIRPKARSLLLNKVGSLFRPNIRYEEI